METKLKHRLALGAAGVVILAGAGGTFAATRGSGDDERKAFVNDAAKRLDVSPEKLKAALQGAFLDRLDAAVKAGRLTRAQADEIKRRAKREGGGLPFLGPPHGGLHRFGGPGGPHGGPPLFDAASKYLGLSRRELFQQLRSGKSLAQVARSRGKSVDGLKTAIKNGVKARLDKAVANKRITSSQREDLLRHLDEEINEHVDRAGPPFGPGRRFRGRPRFGPGPPPGAGERPGAVGPGAGPPPLPL